MASLRQEHAEMVEMSNGFETAGEMQILPARVEITTTAMKRADRRGLIATMYSKARCGKHAGVPTQVAGTSRNEKRVFALQTGIIQLFIDWVEIRIATRNKIVVASALIV